MSTRFELVPLEPYDFAETTRLLRTGRGDPTVQRLEGGLLRTAHLEAGPVTVCVQQGAGVLEVEAWGPGAASAPEVVPRWLGLHQEPWSLPAHPAVDRLLHAHPGVRLNDTGDVFEALVNLVLQQLVTWNEAAMTWRRLCEALGEPAPGPHGLRLSPTPEAIRRAGTDRLQACGIGRQRARTLMELARSAHALPEVADLPTSAALERMQVVRGIGPWTASMVAGMRLGRPEPVVLGDVHLPNTVAWGLMREPRADDARMQELLAPFTGQVFRVLRLLHAARVQAPRRGPRRRAWR